MMDDEPMVRLLLHHGAKINARSDDGSTPLHRAAACGCLRAMRVLIDGGAKVNSRNKLDRTAVGAAVRARQWAAVSLLFAPRDTHELIDVDLVDGADGLTELHHAVGTLCDRLLDEPPPEPPEVAAITDVISQLIRRGADVRKPSATGSNALDTAAQAGMSDLAVELERTADLMRFRESFRRDMKRLKLRRDHSQLMLRRDPLQENEEQDGDMPAFSIASSGTFGRMRAQQLLGEAAKALPAVDEGALVSAGEAADNADIHLSGVNGSDDAHAEAEAVVAAAALAVGPYREVAAAPELSPSLIQRARMNSGVDLRSTGPPGSSAPHDRMGAIAADVVATHKLGKAWATKATEKKNVGKFLGGGPQAPLDFGIALSRVQVGRAHQGHGHANFSIPLSGMPGMVRGMGGGF